MRSEIIRYLDEHSDIKYYVRMHPKWYRKLGRNPELVSKLRTEADEFYGRTINKRIERLGQRLDMLNMMMEMAKVMGEN